MITVVDELADKDVAPVVVEFFRGVAAAVVIAEAVLVVSMLSAVLFNTLGTPTPVGNVVVVDIIGVVVELTGTVSAELMVGICRS